MTLSGFDAAYPPANPPSTDVVFIYAGGDTPHPWSDAEIAAQPARYRVPIWVRSNGPVTQADADGMVHWLQAHNVPAGSVTVLDLETLVDAPGVTNYGNWLHAHGGYLVLPYGSRSTLYQNPKLDGYWDAHPGDPAGTIDPGNVATQDIYAGSYDLDAIVRGLPLWDTKPVASTTRPPDVTRQPHPTTNQPQEILMGLPSNCSDQEAVKAQIKEWWDTYRSDPCTVGALELLLYCFYIPTAEHGFGGSPFELLSNIVDGAGPHLRPQYAGAV